MVATSVRPPSGREFTVDLADAERILGGLAAVGRIESKIDEMRELMTTAAEGIAGLGAKVDAMGAVVTDVHNDFTALIAAMNAERENLTAAGQAALDAANAGADAAAAKLADLDVAVGDADGSDTPPA